MALTDVDIDQDGQADHVLRYEQGKCRRMFEGFPYFYESALLVLDDDRRTIDYARTDLLVQHLFKNAKYRVGIPNFQLYQVFSYKGTVYLDKWNGGGGDKQDSTTLTLHQPEANTVSVYLVNKGQANKLCQIRLFPTDVAPHN